MYAKVQEEKTSSAKKVLELRVLENLPIVKDAVASYNRATTSEEREMVLSTLAKHFSLKSLNELGFSRPITRRLHHYARSHAKAFGAGLPAWTRETHVHRVKVDVYEEALAFISKPENMQQVSCTRRPLQCCVLVLSADLSTIAPQVAFGTKSLKLSDGTEVTIAANQRKVLQEPPERREYRA